MASEAKCPPLYCVNLPVIVQPPELYGKNQETNKSKGMGINPKNSFLKKITVKQNMKNRGKNIFLNIIIWSSFVIKYNPICSRGNYYSSECVVGSIDFGFLTVYARLPIRIISVRK